MAETVPRIKLSDPQSKTTAPTNAALAQSPSKAANTTYRRDEPQSKADGEAAGEKCADTSERDAPPGSHPGNADDQRTAPRPASGGRITPNKLLRNLSSNAIAVAVNGQVGRDGGVDSQHDAQASIDPLSKHILKRTHTQSITPMKARSPSDLSLSHTLSQGSEGLADGRHGSDVRLDAIHGGSREKRKGVKFLSRLIPNKKRDTLSDDNGGEQSETGDGRAEGIDAQIFSHSVDNMGYSPRHPQPPAYIRVRSRNRKEKYFNRLFLAQEIGARDSTNSTRKSTGANNNSKTKGPSAEPTVGAIWAMEFSKDGKYLAAGGQDKVVRVWQVLSTRAERQAHEEQEDMEDTQEQHMRLSAPVFRKEPVREYEGHTAAVLDLSWSKNNFLLSSSMDKTVRLWHVSRTECLCAFKHSDFVTSIQFHPRDDRFFLAGSLDSKVRLWSIPDKSVAFWNQVHDLITAVAFTPDGKAAIAGCLSGLCVFYETEGMRYQTQMHVRSAHGKNARGSKITGIQAINMPPDNINGDIKILVTSNDSRIRMYNYRDKSLEIKLKGNENSSSQIHATFSDDARHVICGSEDRKSYIWDISPSADSGKTGKRPVEMFETHNTITTVALLAPRRTRQLLSASEDPIYDLCNAPPVTLVSRSESSASKRPAVNDGAGSIQRTPAAAEGGDSFKKPEENPAYVARCDHPHGNIIVTSDANGRIKVFRQDCAHNKRRTDWDASSIFSKRVGSSIINRAASLTTRNSGGSRRGSVNTQPADDRIMSWRQNIASTGSLDHISSLRHGKGRYERSMSPRKSNGTFSANSPRHSNGTLNRHPSMALAETPLSNVSSFTSAQVSEHEEKSSTETNQTSTSFQSAHGHQKGSSSIRSPHSTHQTDHQQQHDHRLFMGHKHDKADNDSTQPSQYPQQRLASASEPFLPTSTEPSQPARKETGNKAEGIEARWMTPANPEEGATQGPLGGLFYTLNSWREQLTAGNNSRLAPPAPARSRSRESVVSKLSSEETSGTGSVKGEG